MTDAPYTDLGGYLRRARERTQPEAVGLTTTRPRRVRGLRREEVASLAGVSPTYYTRLEQSHTPHASPTVLRALARALALSPDDETYLVRIGTPAENRTDAEPSSDRIGPHTAMLVGSLGSAAVAVVNHRCDILAWNPLYHRLFVPHLAQDAPTTSGPAPNIIRLNFLDDAVRKIYLEWDVESYSNVAYLRYVVGKHGRDPQLAALIHELASESAEFATLWQRQLVSNCASGRKPIQHPAVGRVELFYESADLRDGNVIKFFYAAPGTADDVALTGLASDPTSAVDQTA